MCAKLTSRALLIVVLCVVGINLNAQELPDATETETASPSPTPAAITQQIGLSVVQEGFLNGIRTSNPLNVDNWQKNPELEAQMDAKLDWYIGFGDRVQFNLGADMRWKQASGSLTSENINQRAIPVLNLDEALVDLYLHEIGARVMAGKTMRKYGVALLLPVCDLLNRETTVRNDPNHGKWMAGFSWGNDVLSAEAWYAPWILDDVAAVSNSTDRPALIFANATLSLDVHRLGLLYYYNGAQNAGVWYSGQLGDEVLPYAECMVSDHALVKIAGTPVAFSRPDSWSVDATGGLGLTPTFIDANIYLEYRYRSSGFTAEDWNQLSTTLADPAPATITPQIMGQLMQARGNVSQTMPWFQTAVHTVGFRIQSAHSIADKLDWTFMAFWLAPDGLFVRAEAIVQVIEQWKITLGASAYQALTGQGEMPWISKTWQADLALAWSAKTTE